MDSLRIQARSIVVSPERVLQPGQVVIERGRLVEVTDSIAQPATVDLGDAILLPGLVNCHTHLEFSHFTEPIAAGANFPEWIGRVVRHRRQQTSHLDEAQLAAALAAAVTAGAQECFHSGTCLIADIVTAPWSATAIPRAGTFRPPVPPAQSPTATQRRYPYTLPQRDWEHHLAPVSYPRLIACPEIIGLDAVRFEHNLRWAQAIAASELTGVSPVLCGLGISPHAPYSLWAEGARALSNAAWPASQVMAMHVAESLDERQWASTGTGAFRNAFEQLGVPLADDRLQIEEAIGLLQAAQRSLLIHGNFLNDRELDQLAESPHVSVVACPRTHTHFGHPPYPLDAMQRRGMNVVIGTDSRASNPDLNLWREMKAARHKHPQLSAAAALGAITSKAAQALGWDRELGTLEAGKLAYINVLRTEQPVGAAELLEFITAPEAANFSTGNAGDTEEAPGYPRPITWELVQSQ